MKFLMFMDGVPQSKARNDDDGADRLSHRYTTAILIVFSIIITTSQYVGNPIKCWVPAHFTGNHEDYTHNYCWVKNTYYLPFEEYIPQEHEHENRHMITYYQWVPLILLVQALLYFMPCLVWRCFNVRSGIDVNDIVETGQTFHQSEKIEEKDKKLEQMTTQMDRYLTSRKMYNRQANISITYFISKVLCPCSSRERGNFLVILYILVKLLYLANTLGQLFVMDLFMNHQFSFYGIYVMSQVAQGEPWTASPRFPRVTMCDFKLRRLGNVQRYTVQCVLPNNIFNEKIFLFMWFWMVIVAIVTLLSLFRWILRFIFRKDRHRYVRKHLLAAGFSSSSISRIFLSARITGGHRKSERW